MLFTYPTVPSSCRCIHSPLRVFSPRRRLAASADPTPRPIAVRFEQAMAIPPNRPPCWPTSLLFRFYTACFSCPNRIRRALDILYHVCAPILYPVCAPILNLLRWTAQWQAWHSIRRSIANAHAVRGRTYCFHYLLHWRTISWPHDPTSRSRCRPVSIVCTFTMFTRRPHMHCLLCKLDHVDVATWKCVDEGKPANI